MMNRLFVLLVLTALAGALRGQQPGDVVVVFETRSPGKADSDIRAQRISRDGKLVWGDIDHPVAVATSRDIETSPVACDDGEGGAFVVYEYEFADGEHKGDRDIVVEHVDRNGKVLWAEPKAIASSKGLEAKPIVVSDGQGGAIVVYSWTGADGDHDLMAARFDHEGKCLWNDGKKPAVVANSPGTERNPCVTSDGQGGILVFFEWEGKNGDVDIMAQHITAEGKVLWEANDRALDVAASANLERHPVAVSDGAGGAIVVFELEYTSGEYKGDTDIMAQRVSRDGKLLWGDSTHSATVASSPELERNPAAIADGAGGALVAFELDPRSGENKGDIDVFAQRIDAEGHMKWNDAKNSVQVSSSKDLERRPAVASDGAGGMIVAVESELQAEANKGDIDIVAQRMSGAGEMLWQEGKRSTGVGTSRVWQELAPIVLSDGLGGAIIVYEATARKGEYVGDHDIEAARVDSAGKLMWLNGERAVDIAAGRQLEQNPSAFVSGAP
jgi:hypothetical protein